MDAFTGDAMQWVLLSTGAIVLYAFRARVYASLYDSDAISSTELRDARAYAMQYIVGMLPKTRYFALEGSTAYLLRYTPTDLPRPVSRIVRFVDFVTYDPVLWTQHWSIFLPRERVAPVLLASPVRYEGVYTPGMRSGETALLVRIYAFTRRSTIVKDCLAIVPLVSLFRVTDAYVSHLLPGCAPGRLCLIPGLVAKDGLVRDRRISSKRLKADALHISCAMVDRHDPSRCDGCFRRPKTRGEWQDALRRAKQRLLDPKGETEYFHFACPEGAPADASGGCRTVTLRKRPTTQIDRGEAMPLYALVSDIREYSIEDAYANQLKEGGVRPDMLQHVRRTDFFRDDPEFRRLRREVSGVRDVCGPEFDVTQLDDFLVHLFERGYLMREVAMGSP